MSGGPFLNIRAPKELRARLDDSRFAARKPSRAEAARELLDRALRAYFEVSRAEAIRPGDADYALVRARRRQPVGPLPIREIDARPARRQKPRAGGSGATGGGAR